jgi:phosphoesterase RecJ-like protein
MEQILQLIREHNQFVIAGHSNPDGDAIGSCYALAIALEKMGKEVHVLLEPYPLKFNIIPGRRHLHAGLTDKLPIDVFICLDCADIERINAAKSVFERSEVTICIDHHETNKGFAQYNLIEPHAPATAEIVLRVIDNLIEIDEEIAVAIYAGLVCDTGGFRYQSTSKATMETAARLIGMGINFTQIYSELIHVRRFAAGKAMGVALDNMSQSSDCRIVYSFMTRDMLSQVGAAPSDLDGVVEYLMGIRGAEIALLVYEKHTLPHVKVSMRSRGPNVGNVANALGGGGHCLAAGCTITGPIDSILEQVLFLLERELQVYEQEQL